MSITITVNDYIKRIETIQHKCKVYDSDYLTFKQCYKHQHYHSDHLLLITGFDRANIKVSCQEYLCKKYLNENLIPPRDMGYYKHTDPSDFDIKL